MALSPINYLNTFLCFPPIFPSFPYLLSNSFPISHLKFFDFISTVKAVQIPIWETLQRRYESLKPKNKISLDESFGSFEEIELAYYQHMALNKFERRVSKQIQSLIIALATILELLARKSIGNFSEMEWNTLQSLLPKIQLFDIKHELFLMLGIGDHQRCWTLRLDNLLIRIINSLYPRLVGTDGLIHEANVKWKTVAMDFCRKTGDFNAFKTQKQCKERWLNHLNPHLKRKNWTSEEDISLLEESIKVNMKWSEVSKKIIGRTQHSVKNRFIYLLNTTLDISREKIRENIQKKEVGKFAALTLDHLKKLRES